MQMYVGITDYDWFEFLKSKNAKEVNFWKPGTQPFKALEENDLFLFKLHAPRDYIVGGGFFVKYSLLPTYLAWNAFGEKNRLVVLSLPMHFILMYKIGFLRRKRLVRVLFKEKGIILKMPMG